ncbi:MAG: hypothetical protein Ct9H300mP11_08090 [Chloroflexota bacterium]|nr:MAG: hypothetical protein Ct9H300mP11_08090 [Chloroflexota bacterium]
MPLDYTNEEVAVIRRAIAPPPPKPPELVIDGMRPSAGMPVPITAALLEISDLECPYSCVSPPTRWSSPFPIMLFS